MCALTICVYVHAQDSYVAFTVRLLSTLTSFHSSSRKGDGVCVCVCVSEEREGSVEGVMVDLTVLRSVALSVEQYI